MVVQVVSNDGLRLYMLVVVDINLLLQQQGNCKNIALHLCTLTGLSVFSRYSSEDNPFALLEEEEEEGEDFIDMGGISD